MACTSGRYARWRETEASSEFIIFISLIRSSTASVHIRKRVLYVAVYCLWSGHRRRRNQLRIAAIDPRSVKFWIFLSCVFVPANSPQPKGEISLGSSDIARSDASPSYISPSWSLISDVWFLHSGLKLWSSLADYTRDMKHYGRRIGPTTVFDEHCVRICCIPKKFKFFFF